MNESGNVFELLCEQGSSPEVWIFCQECPSRLTCLFHKFCIRKREHGEVRCAGLLDTEEFTGTAHTQIMFREYESVISLRHDLQAF